MTIKVLNPHGLALYMAQNPLTQLNTTLPEHEWLKIVCQNYKSRLLSATKDCTTSAIRGNQKNKTKLHQMKLVEASSALTLSLIHPLIGCNNV